MLPGLGMAKGKKGRTRNLALLSGALNILCFKSLLPKLSTRELWAYTVIQHNRRYLKIVAIVPSHGPINVLNFRAKARLASMFLTGLSPAGRTTIEFHFFPWKIEGSGKGILIKKAEPPCKDKPQDCHILWVSAAKGLLACSAFVWATAQKISVFWRHILYKPHAEYAFLRIRLNMKSPSRFIHPSWSPSKV